MNRVLLALGILFSFVAPALGKTLTITDVGVITMTSDTVLKNHTVVVRDGKIAAIVPARSTAEIEGIQVDGKGKFLMPALAEMHAHVPGRGNGKQYVQDVLNLYLANGITTIRGMLGQPWHLELRQQLAEHEITGPRLITSGPSFNSRSVTSPGQAAKIVRAQHAAGYDFLKLHPGLSRGEYVAFVATAKSLGIPFAGHVSEHVGIPLTLNSGQATIDHLDGYAAVFESGFNERLIYEMAVATKNAGVWNVPTQSLYENRFAGRPVDELMARPEMAFVRPATATSWRNRVLAAHRQLGKDEADNFMQLKRSLILQLQKSGAGLLLGSDAPQVMNVPGFAIHEELAYLVNAGLTPFEALATGTVNVALFFAEDKRGKIAEGFIADMVLLNGNPLEDIGNTRKIEAVMRAGRWFDRSWLDKTLNGIRERKI
jgi:imidazolonepropionase-like amidohydrolase